jgi:2-dehydro-3-deoxyphosphogalactonate aldolase
MSPQSNLNLGNARVADLLGGRGRLPLVAILRGIEPHEVLDHAQRLVDAGFEMLEVPTNSPGWHESVALLAQAFDARGVLIGAGTVTTLAHLQALQRAGGRLVVTPHTDTVLIRTAAECGLTTLIGCYTASEAFAALQAGAQALKLFPALGAGPGHVRALRAVLPADLPFWAVGGIGPENLRAFLEAGCQGAGLGGELYRRGQSVDDTARRAQDFISVLGGTLPAAYPSA